MARTHFPQFQDGEKATRETARRLNASAKFENFTAETIKRERDALERSRLLLTLPRDPLELARQVEPVPAPSPRSKPKAKKHRK